MFVKIFSTAAFLILSWLTMVSTDTRAIMSSVEDSSTGVESSLASRLESSSDENKVLIEQVNSRLDEIITSRSAAESDRSKSNVELEASKTKLSAKDKEIGRIKNILQLREAYTTVLEAEIFSRAGNAKAALQSLQAAKKSIYSVSGKLSKSKDKLRKLMGPIDILNSKWKKGDSSSSSLDIRKVLKAEITTNKL